ncbi:hypothetical protein FQN60_018699 [Etheostoma spectabile]|uniref:Uncharacterized protein n=1 Tax=Etheostoma spectabile TaxID=54343 RepID=A0A5J5CAJ5_9PERO|nr:hypothetical protein FQN60_018699 [Etheostoma spectabile]
MLLKLRLSLVSTPEGMKARKLPEEEVKGAWVQQSHSIPNTFYSFDPTEEGPGSITTKIRNMAEQLRTKSSRSEPQREYPLHITVNFQRGGGPPPEDWLRWFNRQGPTRVTIKELLITETGWAVATVKLPEDVQSKTLTHQPHVSLPNKVTTTDGPNCPQGEDFPQVPDTLWAASKTDVGLLKTASPMDRMERTTLVLQ